MENMKLKRKRDNIFWPSPTGNRTSDLNLGFLNKFPPTTWILREIRSIELTVLKKSRLYSTIKYKSVQRSVALFSSTTIFNLMSFKNLREIYSIRNIASKVILKDSNETLHFRFCLKIFLRFTSYITVLF